MSLKSLMIPFLQVLGGVLADYATTAIGLSMGFHETNPQYNPVFALMVFSSITAMLTLIIPRKKPWNLSLNGIALAAYLGAANNILVILGFFPI